MFKQIKGYWINPRRITFSAIKPSQEVFTYASGEYELIISFQNYNDCLYISFASQEEAEQALEYLLSDLK